MKYRNIIKSLIIRFLVLAINNSGVYIAGGIINFMSRLKPGLVKHLLPRFKVNIISSLSDAGKYVRCYSIFGPEESGKYLFKTLLEPCYEPIHLPAVWGISKGGDVIVRERGVYLLEFCDAEFTSLSDFIRVGDVAYWDKCNRFQLTKTIVYDRDLVYRNRKAGYVFLEKRTKKVRVKFGFSLCGVHVTSWGHFVGNFLPKIASLVDIQNRKELTILLPKNVDEHIKEMVTIAVHNYGVNKILLIEDDEVVLCDRLYYCSAPSFLADNLDYIQPYDVHLSSWAVSKIRLITASPSFYSADGYVSPKLFIGRRGIRNLTNWEEVERYFISHGFEIIFPHLLSFKDKVSKFSTATHVCGPFSSGFANVIFCKPGTKILGFANVARTMDCFLSDIACGEFKLDATFLVGDEDLPAAPHQEFSISLEKIETALAEIRYLN